MNFDNLRPSYAIKPSVNSEIAPLKDVLLHSPGKELEDLTPDNLEEMLFDDIPWLEKMQEEHSRFADVLVKNGCRVHYIDRILDEVFENSTNRSEIAECIIAQHAFSGHSFEKELIRYFESLSPDQFTRAMIVGIRYNDIFGNWREKLYPHYLLPPLPNFYFTRDPGFVISNYAFSSRMYRPVRNRESDLVGLVYRHLFENESDSLLTLPHGLGFSLEGGDILNLNETCLLAGISERTSAVAVEHLGRLLIKHNSPVKQILLARIPRKRAYMHLDTILTMIDYNKFIAYPGAADEIEVYTMSLDKNEIKIDGKKALKESLKKALDCNIEIIYSGGSDKSHAAREQWNDSTNTLTIAPGKVITYNRNTISNKIMRDSGVNVIEIDGSELVRGRGGPRCMSHPLHRQS